MGYDRLSYLPVNICICIPPRTLLAQTWYVISTFHYAIADRARMEGVIIVILCTLYCNVFSLVNETWGNLTALHSILHQHRVSSCHWLASGLSVWNCVWRRCCFGEWFAVKVGSYSFKARMLLLASPKSPILSLIRKRITIPWSTAHNNNINLKGL